MRSKESLCLHSPVCVSLSALAQNGSSYVEGETFDHQDSWWVDMLEFVSIFFFQNIGVQLQNHFFLDEESISKLDQPNKLEMRTLFTSGLVNSFTSGDAIEPCSKGKIVSLHNVDHALRIWSQGHVFNEHCSWCMRKWQRKFNRQKSSHSEHFMNESNWFWNSAAMM